MNRRNLIWILLISTAPVGLGASPPSDYWNSRLPKWLRLSGEYRLRLEGPAEEDLYALNRVRIHLKLRPSNWIKFAFEGQDSRVWGNTIVPSAPPYKDAMDLRQGFLELGDIESKWFGIRAGRQDLSFGEQRLLGGLNWSNTARSFDAVRATMRRAGYRVDAFAASVVNIRDGEFNKRRDGDNLHGLYGGIGKLIPKATVEPYVFWRVAPRLDLKTFGFRWTGKLPAGFDYGMEIAGQTGASGAEESEAWAGHWVVGHTLAGLRSKPRIYAEYNYASGDKDPGDGKRETFDQLYPTAHEKYGLADQVGWRNIHHARAGIECRPHRSWLALGSYHSWWLASVRDGLYNSAGTMTARSIDGSAGPRVGQEFDLQVIYTLSTQIQVGAGFAHIFPGPFLKTAAPGRARNFPYWMLSYGF